MCIRSCRVRENIACREMRTQQFTRKLLLSLKTIGSCVRIAVSLGFLKRCEDSLSIESLDDLRVGAVMENGPLQCEHDGFGDCDGIVFAWKCAM